MEKTIHKLEIALINSIVRLMILQKKIYGNLEEKALIYYRDSLFLYLLNSMSWIGKVASSKTDRLIQHICAFTNLQGGGLLVYGVNNGGCSQ
jgi:hypothetical protein